MRSFTLYFFLALSNMVWAQDSLDIFQLGVDLSMGTSAFPGKGNYSPSIVLSGKKHSVFAGPVFVTNPFNYKNLTAVGIQAGFMLYPNGKKNRFNLFFADDLNFLQSNVADEFDGPTSLPNGGVKKRIRYFFYMYNYLSFGFRLNIIKGLYCKTSAGLGFGTSRDQVVDEFWDGTASGRNQSAARLDFGTLIKFGVGYDLLWLGKK